jgi:hypothetical protein
MEYLTPSRKNEKFDYFSDKFFLAMETLNVLVTGAKMSGKSTFIRKLICEDYKVSYPVPTMVTINWGHCKVNLFDDAIKKEYPIHGVLLFHNRVGQWSPNPYDNLPTIDVVSKFDKGNGVCQEEDCLPVSLRRLETRHFFYNISAFTDYHYDKPLTMLARRLADNSLRVP